MRKFIYDSRGQFQPTYFWVTMFCALVFFGVLTKWIWFGGPMTEDFAVILVNGWTLIHNYRQRRNAKDKIASGNH